MRLDRNHNSESLLQESGRKKLDAGGEESIACGPTNQS